MARFRQGYYKPINPNKYVGVNIEKIRYMSSWELAFMKFLDGNPTDGRMHRYFPDFYIEYVDKHGEIKQEMIEIKPLEERKMPNKRNKHYLYAAATYEINVAKWKAAQAYCDAAGYKFRLLSQDQLFGAR